MYRNICCIYFEVKSIQSFTVLLTLPILPKGVILYMCIIYGEDKFDNYYLNETSHKMSSLLHQNFRWNCNCYELLLCFSKGIGIKKTLNKMCSNLDFELEGVGVQFQSSLAEVQLVASRQQGELFFTFSVLLFLFPFPASTPPSSSCRSSYESRWWFTCVIIFRNERIIASWLCLLPLWTSKLSKLSRSVSGQERGR